MKILSKIETSYLTDDGREFRIGEDSIEIVLHGQWCIPSLFLQAEVRTAIEEYEKIQNQEE